jgi:mono/diheme cytochrome c family protein
MVRFLAGCATVLGLMALVGLAVVEFGAFDTRAITQHDPVSAWVIHTTFINTTRRAAAGVVAPASFSADQIQDGARDYDQSCALCHGGPGVARAPWVEGMNPSPPFLLDSGRNWTAGQLYWIIGDGVKMTGMPAWRMSRSDRQIWDLVAFLKAMPNLSATDYAKLTGRPPPKPGPSS